MSTAAPAATRLKCAVRRENLRRALQVVRPAVAQRSTHPACSTVLFKSDGGRLAVTATDLDIAITTWIGARIDQDGASTIGYRRLAEWAKWLGPVTVALTQEEQRLTLSGTGFSLSGYTLPAEDFPVLKGIAEPDLVLEFRDPEALRAAARRVSMYAAPDDSRPVLTGVVVDVKGVTVTLAGEDGFRLAVEQLCASSVLGDQECTRIVPARALALLPKLFSGSEPIVLRSSPHAWG